MHFGNVTEITTFCSKSYFCARFQSWVAPHRGICSLMRVADEQGIHYCQQEALG